MAVFVHKKDRAAKRQPGQWVDVTPVDVKKKQAEAWKEFEAMMKNTDRKEVSDNA